MEDFVPASTVAPTCMALNPQLAFTGFKQDGQSFVKLFLSYKKVCICVPGDKTSAKDGA
jgi:hypothetical protein